MSDFIDLIDLRSDTVTRPNPAMRHAMATAEVGDDVYGDDPTEHGVLDWPMIASAIGPKIYYRAQTALICLENTHNMAGGTVTPLATMQEIWAEAAKVGLPVHLDGARVFNAAASLKIPVAELTSGFDTISFCLSKGLGAPVGSILVGSAKHIEQARIHRKALGGGMRQAGILAAAGLIALQEMPARLHEDHANARILAEAVATQPTATIDLESVQTNIVIFNLADDGDAPNFCAALKERGVLASAIAPHSVRFVTHYDVSTADCKAAAEIVAGQLQASA
jgi:threonine aldolase